MSEFQGYAFRAVDRPLTSEEMEELRGISSRADISPTHFSNFYSYGSFKGDVDDFLKRYFDAFVYVANWGTHRLMFRLPAEALDLDAAKEYETETTVGTRRAGKGTILLELTADLEGGGEWLEEDDADQWLSKLLPLREELIGGDTRALYLGWLAGVEQGETEDDEQEPPVPPGLQKLSGPLEELADFLDLSEDLLRAAAEGSAAGEAGASEKEMAAWVNGLSASEKDALLLAAMRGKEPHLGRSLLRRFEQQRPRPAKATAKRRTAGALREAAEAQERRARQEKEEKAARERERQLTALVGQESRLWHEIEQALASRRPSEYAEAVSRLVNLQALARRANQETEFVARLHQLRAAHAGKRAFLQRLDQAGLT